MGGSNTFDQIAQAIQGQQQILEKLKEENRALQSQLAALRSGRGIALIVGDARFELQGQIEPQPEATVNEAALSQMPEQKIVDPQDAPTETLATPSNASAPAPSAQLEQEAVTPSFLEEMMIDEFSSAMTNPMAIWNGPQKQKKEESQPEEPEKPVELDEAQKAALRRELMGSFLLE
ncbi:MAG: hypothetical protein J2P37_27280 [Ktedonobacteraceae bacterium]|nr:hypothetical protein [Ktedonobacteraceae bacterium]